MCLLASQPSSKVSAAHDRYTFTHYDKSNVGTRSRWEWQHGFLKVWPERWVWDHLFSRLVSRLIKEIECHGLFNVFVWRNNRDCFEDCATLLNYVRTIKISKISCKTDSISPLIHDWQFRRSEISTYSHKKLRLSSEHYLSLKALPYSLYQVPPIFFLNQLLASSYPRPCIWIASISPTPTCGSWNTPFETLRFGAAILLNVSFQLSSHLFLVPDRSKLWALSFFIVNPARFLGLLLFKMVNFNLGSNRLTFLLYFFFAIFWSFTRAACYYPNGIDMAESDTIEPLGDYAPCNSGNEHSMCCARWDTCRSDGLCYSNWNGGKHEVFRDGCTDRTWKSPSCVKLCLDGKCKQSSSSKPRFREVWYSLMLIKPFKYPIKQLV